MCREFFTHSPPTRKLYAHSFYHLTTPHHLSHGCSTPRNFFSSSKNPRKLHTHSLIAPCHLVAHLAACLSPYRHLPLVSWTFFTAIFLPFSSFSYAVFARYPLVCCFHTVHCWFHSSSLVSSRFLLFAYSSCWFHSSSPFSYSSSPILPWFAVCVQFFAGFILVPAACVQLLAGFIPVPAIHVRFFSLSSRPCPFYNAYIPSS